MADVRIKLKLEDFDKLTSWEIVSRDWVEIILADIWYLRMIDMLEKKLSDMLQK